MRISWRSRWTFCRLGVRGSRVEAGLQAAAAVVARPWQAFKARGASGVERWACQWVLSGRRETRAGGGGSNDGATRNFASGHLCRVFATAYLWVGGGERSVPGEDHGDIVCCSEPCDVARLVYEEAFFPSSLLLGSSRSLQELSMRYSLECLSHSAGVSCHVTWLSVAAGSTSISTIHDFQSWLGPGHGLHL